MPINGALSARLWKPCFKGETEKVKTGEEGNAASALAQTQISLRATLIISQLEECTQANRQGLRPVTRLL